MNIEKNLDMTLTLDDKGGARMSYVDHESGETYGYSFHFTGELGEDRNAKAFTIGQEILSWFDVMKDILAQQNKEETE